MHLTDHIHNSYEIGYYVLNDTVSFITIIA